jgi:hypothetical protein
MYVQQPSKAFIGEFHKAHFNLLPNFYFSIWHKHSWIFGLRSKSPSPSPILLNKHPCLQKAGARSVKPEPDPSPHFATLIRPKELERMFINSTLSVQTLLHRCLNNIGYGKITPRRFSDWLNRGRAHDTKTAKLKHLLEKLSDRKCLDTIFTDMQKKLYVGYTKHSE